MASDSDNIELEGLNPRETSSTNSSFPNKNNKTNDENTSAIDDMIYQLRNAADHAVIVIQMIKDVYPKPFYTCTVITSVLLFYFLIIVPISVRSKTLKRNFMTQDYSDLQLDYNFQAAKIDHYCLYGGDNKCECSDPTESVSKEDVSGWANAYRKNAKNVQTAIAQNKNKEFDVVFVGDELAEAFTGNTMGRPDARSNYVATLFNYTFGHVNGKGGLLETDEICGLALGITGDGATNLMWRLQHDEMPSNLKSKVFWLMIGMNDLTAMGCSEEVVTLGILRVAEEIAFKNPFSVIVIQALLPMSYHADGSLKLSKDTGKSKYATQYLRERHPNMPIPKTQFKTDYFPMTGNIGGDRRDLSASSSVENRNLINQNKTGLGDRVDDNLKKREETIAKKKQRPIVALGNPNPGTREKLTKQQIENAMADKAKRFPYNTNKNNGADMKYFGPTSKFNAAKDERFVRDLWTPISAINYELEQFCKKHEHFVYYDASAIFIGSIGNDHYTQSTQQILPDLMPDFMHLSNTGYKVLSNAIADELKRIIISDDESNDIVKKSDYST